MEGVMDKDKVVPREKVERAFRQIMMNATQEQVLRTLVALRKEYDADPHGYKRQLPRGEYPRKGVETRRSGSSPGWSHEWQRALEISLDVSFAKRDILHHTYATVGGCSYIAWLDAGNRPRPDDPRFWHKPFSSRTVLHGSYWVEESLPLYDFSDHRWEP